MDMNLSNALADAAATVSASVVQVRARQRAASGLVYADGIVVTMGRVLGRDEAPEVRTPDGRILPAEFAGWDPGTRLAVLHVAGLGAPPLAPAPLPRVGHLTLAVARSWSNDLTVTAGVISVIGGPLRTGPRRQIEQVIRTSAPMHDGFAGGALIGADGGFLGVATAAAIRGLGVVIPAAAAWTAVESARQHGRARRGYLGIAAQPVGVPEKQRGAGAPAEALLVVGVKAGSPADAAGIFVGDLLVSVDGHGLASPDDLLELLAGDRAGRELTARLIRGSQAVEVRITPVSRDA